MLVGYLHVIFFAGAIPLINGINHNVCRQIDAVRCSRYSGYHGDISAVVPCVDVVRGDIRRVEAGQVEPDATRLGLAFFRLSFCIAV